MRCLKDASEIHPCRLGNHPRVERDHQDLQALTNVINSTISSFLGTVNQNSLFNLKIGKQASKATEAYLLTVFKAGNSKRDTFVGECQKRDDRFEEPTKKSTISNLQLKIYFKISKSTEASKLQQAKGTHDILGRLLFSPITK